MSHAPSPLAEITVRIADLWNVLPQAIAEPTSRGKPALARQDVLLLMRLATRASWHGLAKRVDRSPDQVRADIDAAIDRCRADVQHAAALFNVLVQVDQGQPRFTEVSPRHGPEPDRPTADVGGAAALPAPPPPPSRPARPRLSLNHRQSA